MPLTYTQVSSPMLSPEVFSPQTYIKASETSWKFLLLFISYMILASFRCKPFEMSVYIDVTDSLVD
jgi:hypothetical protein